MRPTVRNACIIHWCLAYAHSTPNEAARSAGQLDRRQQDAKESDGRQWVSPSSTQRTGFYARASTVGRCPLRTQRGAQCHDGGGASRSSPALGLGMTCAITRATTRTRRHRLCVHCDRPRVVFSGAKRRTDEAQPPDNSGAKRRSWTVGCSAGLGVVRSVVTRTHGNPIPQTSNLLPGRVI